MLQPAAVDDLHASYYSFVAAVAAGVVAVDMLEAAWELFVVVAAVAAAVPNISVVADTYVAVVVLQKKAAYHPLQTQQLTHYSNDAAAVYSIASSSLDSAD